jgi:hypothetical protein
MKQSCSRSTNYLHFISTFWLHPPRSEFPWRCRELYGILNLCQSKCSRIFSHPRRAYVVSRSRPTLSRTRLLHPEHRASCEHGPQFLMLFSGTSAESSPSAIIKHDGHIGKMYITQYIRHIIFLEQFQHSYPEAIEMRRQRSKVNGTRVCFEGIQDAFGECRG